MFHFAQHVLKMLKLFATLLANVSKKTSANFHCIQLHLTQFVYNNYCKYKNIQ